MKRYKDYEIEELVKNLCKIEKEPEWLEFKCNNKDPKLIGGIAKYEPSHPQRLPNSNLHAPGRISFLHKKNNIRRV